MICPMKYLLMLKMALGLVLPGNAAEKEDSLLGELLGFGARLLDTQLEAPAAPQGAVQQAGASAERQSFGVSFKQTLDALLEGYKEDGRAYAREVGDIVVERVVRDPEISSTITSLRALCWWVIAYLTLVTIIMLSCLVYLKRANARLLATVEQMCREMKGQE